MSTWDCRNFGRLKGSFYAPSCYDTSDYETKHKTTTISVARSNYYQYYYQMRGRRQVNHVSAFHVRDIINMDALASV